jgi:hypothetical protein
MLAMWFQETTLTFSSGGAKLLISFVGLIAVGMVVQAAVQIGASLKAAKAMKDLSDTAQEFKTKLLPLIDSAMEVSKAGKVLIHETTPKVKIIADNLVQTSNALLETSNSVRASAQQFDKTITDVNQRAQRQAARVDAIVTAALTTTVEVAETVQQGVRVPLQKISGIASDLRYGLEGLLAKVKAMAAKSPFANR